MQQLRDHGDFHFYCYMPLSKGGDGLVRYRLGCDQPVFSDAPRTFRHEHGNHHDHSDYLVRLVFRIVAIEELTPPLQLGQFITTAGMALKRASSLQYGALVAQTPLF